MLPLLGGSLDDDPACGGMVPDIVPRCLARLCWWWLGGVVAVVDALALRVVRTRYVPTAFSRRWLRRQRI